MYASPSLPQEWQLLSIGNRCLGQARLEVPSWGSFVILQVQLQLEELLLQFCSAESFTPPTKVCISLFSASMACFRLSA